MQVYQSRARQKHARKNPALLAAWHIGHRANLKQFAQDILNRLATDPLPGVTAANKQRLTAAITAWEATIKRQATAGQAKRATVREQLESILERSNSPPPSGPTTIPRMSRPRVLRPHPLPPLRRVSGGAWEPACALVVKRESQRMIVERLPEVQALSEDEKLQLAAELFQEVAGTPAAQDDALFATLGERMRDLEAKPESAVPWEEVKRRLRARRP